MNMKIIEYSSKYTEDVKNLLTELQEHIAHLDSEKYNILTDQFGDKYFEKTIEEVKEHKGKILLSQEDDKITGLIIGIINNEACLLYTSPSPRDGLLSRMPSSA